MQIVFASASTCLSRVLVLNRSDSEQVSRLCPAPPCARSWDGIQHSAALIVFCDKPEANQSNQKQVQIL